MESIEIKVEPEDVLVNEEIVKEEYRLQELPPSQTIQFEITEVAPLTKKPPIVKKYKCPVCDKLFGTSHNRKEHLVTHTGEKNVQCPQCPKKFGTKRSLKIHLVIHTEGDPLPCSVCEKSFKNSACLREHMKRHAERRHECNVCGRKFHVKKDLTWHIMQVHEGIKRYMVRKTEPYICQQCGKVSHEKIVHQRHLLTHTEVERVECTVCSKKFKSHHSLRRHMEMHTAREAYSCSVCEMKFWRKDTYKKHLFRHVDKSKNCPYCGKSFEKKLHLKDHIKLLHKGLPVDTSGTSVCCTICSEIFNDLPVLMEHVKIHSAEKRFECETCSKIYPEKEELSQHIKEIHKKKLGCRKNFSCRECRKTFRSKNCYMNHQVVHSDDRPFECALCQARFKEKSVVRGHMKMHEKRSVFLCQLCGKKFKWKRNLVAHEKYHDQAEGTEETVNCPNCKDTFTKRRFMAVHMGKCLENLSAQSIKVLFDAIKNE